MSDIITITGKQYRIALTRGGDPSVYRATSFTCIGPPISMPPSEAAISFTQEGSFILAVLEEIAE